MNGDKVMRLLKPVSELKTEDFYSKLSNANSLEEGGVDKEERLQQLKQEWKSLGVRTLEDLCVVYSFGDVEPLLDVASKMCEMYSDPHIGIPIDVFNTHITLPGISLNYTMSKMDSSAHFRIVNEEVYNRMRRGILGGITCVFKSKLIKN